MTITGKGELKLIKSLLIDKKDILVVWEVYKEALGGLLKNTNRKKSIDLVISNDGGTTTMMNTDSELLNSDNMAPLEHVSMMSVESVTSNYSLCEEFTLMSADTALIPCEQARNTTSIEQTDEHSVIELEPDEQDATVLDYTGLSTKYHKFSMLECHI